MKSMRTLTNTQRVSSTCVARATTTVTIADTTVYSTTSAPSGSSRTARAVVTAAVLLSSSWSSSPSPGLVERPDRLPEPLARHPDAVAARSRHVHDPVQEAAPALRPVPVRMPARWDPGGSVAGRAPPDGTPGPSSTQLIPLPAMPLGPPASCPIARLVPDVHSAWVWTPASLQ